MVGRVTDTLLNKWFQNAYEVKGDNGEADDNAKRNAGEKADKWIKHLAVLVMWWVCCTQTNLVSFIFHDYISSKMRRVNMFLCDCRLEDGNSQIIYAYAKQNNVFEKGFDFRHLE